MANIYIRGEGFFYTAPAVTIFNYSQYSNSGSATSSSSAQTWTGINLRYTNGYVFPTSGTLTSLSVSTASGTFLYSADSFAYSLNNVPLLTGPDSLIGSYIAKVEPNSIIGSIYDDSLIAVRDGDFINGGGGNDTLYLFNPSTNYSISNIGVSNSSATITSTNGSINILSVENIKFTDKTVSLSSLVPPSYSITSSFSSVNEGAFAQFYLVTTNVAAGTVISYSISGVSISDLTSRALSGSVIVSSSGTTSILIPIAADSTTEGTENLTLTTQGKSASILINDTSRSSGSNPPLNGTNSSEIFNTSTGNDLIDGGGGIDTVVVPTGISNYTVTKTTAGYTLVDKNGFNGTDTLTNIEAIKFTDKTINLTVQAKAASAPNADVTRLVELYTAFFNRVPDADGMSFWIDEMKSGKTTNQVAEAFYDAGVNYSSLTGFSSSMTNADFINVIYKNVLGRKDGADAGGLSFWQTEITSGRATRGTLVTNILDSAHTFKGDKTWGWVADLLDNKITVAKKFSIDMGLNYNTPEESITKGMAIASAITATDTSAAVTLIGVTEANFYLS
jgi:hypothetical protein